MADKKYQNRFQRTVLKVARKFPLFYERLCRRWNINSLTYWDDQYSKADSDEKWSAETRIYCYRMASELLPRERMTVLDVGSGIGTGGQYLMTQCREWQIEGLDFSREACQRAVIRSHCVDIRTEPLPGTYDYMLIIETLEHLPDTQAVLDKLYAKARRGVVITVPYRGKVSPLHPIVFDESCFSRFPDREIQIRERQEDNGKVSRHMLVLLRAGSSPSSSV